MKRFTQVLRCSSGGSRLCQRGNPFRRQFFLKNFNLFNISRDLTKTFLCILNGPQKWTYCIFPICPSDLHICYDLLAPSGRKSERNICDWMADSSLSLFLCLEDSQCSCTFCCAEISQNVKAGSWSHYFKTHISEISWNARINIDRREIIWVFSHVGNWTIKHALCAVLYWWPVWGVFLPLALWLEKWLPF